MKTSSVLLLFMTSTLVLPLGFYGAQAADQSTDTNQTSSSMNQTGTTTENIGRQVSDFVHNATALFQQQRTENIQAIQDCHQKMQTATSENRTQIIDECHATMNAIREKYQQARNQFQELFKQFRENIIVLRHDAEGLQVSDQDKESAIKNIDDDAAKHGLSGVEKALEHMKGMGENATMGMEKALTHVNETSNENNGQPETPGMPEQSPNQGSHGPPSSPGQSGSHGKQ